MGLGKYDAETRPQGTVPDIGADELSLESQPPEGTHECQSTPVIVSVTIHTICTRMAILLCGEEEHANFLGVMKPVR